MEKDSHALKTDLYEFTMAAGYFQNNFSPQATFELYCHTLPANRSFLISCGQQLAIDYILGLRFSKEDISYLRKLRVFKNIDPAFFRYLEGFKFSGNVWALPEGEICFANDPILQVQAPIIEAQVLETYLLSLMNIQTLVATKAARVVQAATSDGKLRGVIDFGSRRAHGPEAGVLAARAAYIGGCTGTSNVYAGREYDIPVFGTMAHSWIQAFDNEQTAFEKYYEIFPDNSILLVDTYDTIKGVQRVANFSKRIQGIRIDSGDLIASSKKARKILDARGMKDTKIIVSGNLNEYLIKDMVRARAPVDLFGVGTEMVTSRDEPALDLTYKLVQIIEKDGTVMNKSKNSQGKQTVPGAKQVYRRYTSKGKMKEDIIGLVSDADPKGTQPLLQPEVRKGKKVAKQLPIESIREKVIKGLSQLPKGHLNFVDIATYKVNYSKAALAGKTKISTITQKYKHGGNNG
ncbi:MAG: nicotinate phosphoribosyltransferase [Candidatus Omnitrophica bacterium]|nr:nicotinate phosphoribosyltransferase [Candidatus Omnitrophota bacterium]